VADGNPLRLEHHERVAYLTLQRPAALNAIDEPMLAALERDDEQVKALVVTGAGDVFCVGLDVQLLERGFADHEYFRGVLERFRRLLLDVEALPFPVIAAVNGLARAGGFEFALACDLVLIADEARVADHHMSFGIVPGGGATQRAARKLGDQRARELIFTARWVAGPEAVDIGLALRSVPRAQLASAAEELTSVFRSRSRPCLAATKQAMNEGRELPLEAALDVELTHFFRYLDEVPSSDEGFVAYRENREPRWP
jgi:enoyl-CoA hydratase/carnithine racemase